MQTIKIIEQSLRQDRYKLSEDMGLICSVGDKVLITEATRILSKQQRRLAQRADVRRICECTYSGVPTNMDDFLELLPASFVSNETVIQQVRGNYIVGAGVGMKCLKTKFDLICSPQLFDEDDDLHIQLQAALADVLKDYGFWRRIKAFSIVALSAERLHSKSKTSLLEDAKAYWCCLLEVSENFASLLPKTRVIALLALISIARLERRMGNHDAAIAILKAIVCSDQSGDLSNGVARSTFIAALANPTMFDQIEPSALEQYFQL